MAPLRQFNALSTRRHGPWTLGKNRVFVSLNLIRGGFISIWLALSDQLREAAGHCDWPNLDYATRSGLGHYEGKYIYTQNKTYLQVEKGMNIDEIITVTWP